MRRRLRSRAQVLGVLFRWSVRLGIPAIAVVIVTAVWGDKMRLASLREVTLEKGSAPSAGGAFADVSDEEGSPWRSLEGPSGALQGFDLVPEGGDTIIYGRGEHALYRIALGRRERREVGRTLGDGLIRDVQVVPQADGSHELFVLTAAALFASRDGGASWRKLLALAELTPPREPVLQGFSVASGPRGKIVVAASRDEVFWLENDRVEVRDKADAVDRRNMDVVVFPKGDHVTCVLRQSKGVRRATDCRAPWQSVGELDGVNIWAFWKRHAAKPSDELAYASTLPSAFSWRRGHRLWRSRDGENWEEESTPVFLRYFSHPSSADCATSGGEVRVRSNFLSDMTNNLLFSDDRGVRWQKLKLAGAVGDEPIVARCLSVGGDAQIVGSRAGRLVRLDLGRRTWSDEDLSLPVLAVRAVMMDSSGAVWAAAATGLFVKERQGAWKRIDEIKSEVHAIAVPPGGQPIALAVGTSAGLFLLSATDRTWKSDGDLGSRRVTALALGAAHWFAGTDDGVFRREGDDWKRVDATSAGENANAIAVVSDDILIVGGESGAYVSTDGGLTFRRSKPNELGTNVLAVGSLKLDGFTSLLAGSSEGGFVSRDLGISWSRIFPGDGGLRTVSAILPIASDPMGPVVYLGTVGAGLVWSKDLVHWNVDEGGRVRYVSALARRDDRTAIVVGTFDRSVWEVASPHLSGR
jgi:hypothetical protein